jgi:hypothetical protein
MPPHLGALGVPPAQSNQPDLSGLPPRLRERLEREFGRQPGWQSATLRNWLIGISAVAALTITLILMQRFGAIDWPFLRGAAGTRTSQHATGSVQAPATVDPTAALIDSLKREVESARHAAPVRQASTPKEVSQAPTRAANPDEVGTAATPVPPPVTAEKSAKAAEVAPESDTVFGIGVASYLDIDRAREEKDRFAQATTLPSVVVPYNDEGSTMYRVVLGRWATASDAERAANALMEKGAITEARVLAIPRK